MPQANNCRVKTSYKWTHLFYSGSLNNGFKYGVSAIFISSFMKPACFVHAT